MWTWTITDYVRADDKEGVIKRLDAGDSIEERRSGNYTPLINAAYSNKCEMIDLLLDRGADIEAVDKSGLSALRTAIYYRQTEAAVRLATRGADANKIAYQQMTALHAAVNDGQVSVVRALLLNGADLTIESAIGKTAFDYVSDTNVEELNNLLLKFTSLEMAIEAESSETVAVLLKKTLSTSDDAVQAYKTAMVATDAAKGTWRVELLELVEQFELDMLNCAAHSGSTVFMDAVYEVIGKPEWITTCVLDLKGWNVLHLATSQGHMHLVNHLLTNYDCDSRAVDYEGQKASDLVSGNGDDNSKHIHWILCQHEKKTMFMELSSQLLLQNESPTVDLHELPRYMTSIYDLRALYCLASGMLTTDEMKMLLESAFTEAVQAKLMFDDDAAVFFKTVLRESVRLGLLSKERKDFWLVQARHVNTENAEWVREIQNSLVRLEYRVTITERNISSLSQNYNMLRNALETKIRLDEERTRRRKLLGLVTAGLCFCGGPLLDAAFHLAFDLCDTAEAVVTELTDISSEELASTLGGATSAHVLKPSIQAVLEQACIDQTEFKDLLQEAVSLEKAEISERNNKPSSTFTKSYHSPRGQSTRPKFHLRDVVQMTLGLDKERRLQEKNCMLVDHSHLSETVLEAHPYHYVVFYSSGNLNEFKQLVKYIDDGEGDLNSTMEIQVPENSGNITLGTQNVVLSSPTNWKKIQATAVTYASYLGYADIVEWFLQSGPVDKKECISQKPEPGFVVINRARTIKKRLQASTAA